MTPKEKAKELVEKFAPIIRMKMGQEDVLKRAKQCALIAVDEILSAIGFSVNDEYYLEVKQEIEKL